MAVMPEKLGRVMPETSLGIGKKNHTGRQKDRFAPRKPRKVGSSAVRACVSYCNVKPKIISVIIVKSGRSVGCQIAQCTGHPKN